MLQPGQKLFEYEIIRVLGQGSFAAVYQANDKLLKRHVAIKHLHTDKARSEKNVKRFVQEAQVAAALEHPNLITIYSLRIHQESIYMILEYLPGGSVQDLIAHQGKLPVREAIKMMTGICEGLAKLHAQEIIHRDIKAENILLTADGRPKITDFGIAHVPQAAGGMALTRVGFQPSTMLFSSPEQLRGEPLDNRSDIYQVGELFYQLLAGEHYIDMKELETKTESLPPNLKHDLKMFVMLEKAVCKEPPAGLPALRDSVGPVVDVIEKALAKRKEDRYKDILDFATDLWAAQFESGR